SRCEAVATGTSGRVADRGTRPDALGHQIKVWDSMQCAVRSRPNATAGDPRGPRLRESLQGDGRGARVAAGRLTGVRINVQVPPTSRLFEHLAVGYEVSEGQLVELHRFRDAARGVSRGT